MRKLYNEFFHIPKDGKIREKVMLMRVAMTVVVMVICLVALGITAYAYFSYNITSGANIIRTANFKTNVSIQIADKNNEAVVLTQVDRITQSATLHKDNTYSITIQKAGSAETGFCVLTARNCEFESYHTQQLGKDANSGTPKNSITFTLTVTNTTEVTFRAHWGTSSYYGYDGHPDHDNDRYILDGETVVLSILGATSQEPLSDRKEQQIETAPTEATTPSQPQDTAPTDESTAVTEQTTPPDTTPPSEPEATTVPTQATEPSVPENTTEPSVQVDVTEPQETVSTEPTESTENQSTEETAEVSPTEP